MNETHTHIHTMTVQLNQSTCLSRSRSRNFVLFNWDVHIGSHYFISTSRVVFEPSTESCKSSAEATSITISTEPRWCVWSSVIYQQNSISCSSLPYCCADFFCRPQEPFHSVVCVRENPISSLSGGLCIQSCFISLTRCPPYKLIIRNKSK